MSKAANTVLISKFARATNTNCRISGGRSNGGDSRKTGMDMSRAIVV